MDTIGTTWILLAVVGASVIVCAATLYEIRKRRTARLRAQFSPEYVREMEMVQDRHRAEGKLESRMKHVQHFNIRPLTPRDRLCFKDTWRLVQAKFVENPGAAVAEADRLVGDVMSTRVYPLAEFDQRAADLSVDHPHVVQNYRAAHAIAVLHSRGTATTEELRQAMMHYRSLFEELISEPETMCTSIAS